MTVQAQPGDYLAWPCIDDWGNYIPISNFVLQTARQAGYPAVTGDLVNKPVAVMAHE